MAGTSEYSIEKYLREGLLAIYPVYDNDSKSAVLTKVEHRPEKRTLIWLVKQLTTFYNLDLVSLRRRCGGLLNRKHHISLPFSSDLVLLPVKARQAAVPGETTIGYISMLEIKEFLPAGLEAAPPWLSKVIFKNGAEFDTCNTVEKLEKRLEQGNIVRKDFLEKHNCSPCFTGIKRENIIEQLPNCDCLLRELFMERLGL